MGERVLIGGREPLYDVEVTRDDDEYGMWRANYVRRWFGPGVGHVEPGLLLAQASGWTRSGALTALEREMIERGLA